MSRERPRPEQVFLVRVLSSSKASEWRASVTNVKTGQVRYVVDHRDLCDSLHHWIAAPESAD